jgi:hypothetical protein
LGRFQFDAPRGSRGVTDLLWGKVCDHQFITDAQGQPDQHEQQYQIGDPASHHDFNPANATSA